MQSYENVRLVFPPLIYGKSGTTVKFQFDTVSNIDYRLLHWKVDGSAILSDGFEVSKNSLIEVFAYSPFSGELIDSGVIEFKFDNSAPKGKPLFIGDSVTASGDYQRYLLDELNVESETIAFGGWTASRFLNSDDSPFINNGVFDFDSAVDGMTFDDVYISLGINDIFSKGDIASFIANITELKTRIESSGYNVYIMLLTPPVISQDAFADNYGKLMTQTRYKIYYNSAISAIYESFNSYDIVPVSYYIDTVVDFPAICSESGCKHTNALHPNKSGYSNIAKAVYYFMVN